MQGLASDTKKRNPVITASPASARVGSSPSPVRRRFVVSSSARSSSACRRFVRRRFAVGCRQFVSSSSVRLRFGVGASFRRRFVVGSSSSSFRRRFAVASCVVGSPSVRRRSAVDSASIRRRFVVGSPSVVVGSVRRRFGKGSSSVHRRSVVGSASVRRRFGAGLATQFVDGNFILPIDLGDHVLQEGNQIVPSGVVQCARAALIHPSFLFHQQAGHRRLVSAQ